MTKQSTPKTIIVHPGAAHMDDFLAVCFALHLWDIKNVYRRDPTEEELNSKEFGILDVGGRFEPALFNFDHHQLARDAEPACALSMLAESTTFHMAGGDVNLADALELTHWYPLLKVTDSKGPFMAARSVGVTPDQFQQIHANPLAGAVLEMFGGGTTSLSDMDLKVMAALGGRIIHFALDLYIRVEHELTNEVSLHCAGRTAVMVLESEDHNGLNLYRERHCPMSKVSIMYDDRGEGWTLYRFDDHPNIDFSKVEGDPRVLFAHKGGFIAKTKERLPLTEVLELISNSYVETADLA